MPPIEIADLWQTALYWEANARANDDGEITVRSPVEIPCRWIKKRGKVWDAQGNLVSIDATVVLERTVPPGSILWLGTEADYLGTGSGSATNQTEHVEVKVYDETVDIRGMDVRRTAMCSFCKDRLPDVVN